MEKIRATYTLKNVAVIELDLHSDILPKVYSFNMSEDKAKYIKDNHEELKTLAKEFHLNNVGFKVEGQYLTLKDNIFKLNSLLL